MAGPDPRLIMALAGPAGSVRAVEHQRAQAHLHALLNGMRQAGGATAGAPGADAAPGAQPAAPQPDQARLYALLQAIRAKAAQVAAPAQSVLDTPMPEETPK